MRHFNAAEGSGIRLAEGKEFLPQLLHALRNETFFYAALLREASGGGGDGGDGGRGGGGGGDGASHTSEAAQAAANIEQAR